jgi:NAD(P)H-flavin reductase
MNPDYLHRISSSSQRPLETWRYRSVQNRIERVTAYCNKVEVVAMCGSPEMAAEIAKAMEARPEKDLVDGDSHDH